MSLVHPEWYRGVKKPEPGLILFGTDKEKDGHEFVSGGRNFTSKRSKRRQCHVSAYSSKERVLLGTQKNSDGREEV